MEEGNGEKEYFTIRKPNYQILSDYLNKPDIYHSPNDLLQEMAVAILYLKHYSDPDYIDQWKESK